MRYYAERIESAILTISSEEDRSILLFCAKVAAEDEEVKFNTYEIVGEDEVDIYGYLPPLAEALIGLFLG